MLLHNVIKLVFYIVMMRETATAAEKQRRKCTVWFCEEKLGTCFIQSGSLPSDGLIFIIMHKYTVAAIRERFYWHLLWYVQTLRLPFGCTLTSTQPLTDPLKTLHFGEALSVTSSITTPAARQQVHPLSLAAAALSASLQRYAARILFLSSSFSLIAPSKLAVILISV